MPDKKREEFFINLFLEDYNLRTGKRYITVGSPEDDKELTGSYDSLCEDKNSTGDYLAVEEKSLNKSTENVRDNVEIGEIVAEVNRVLNEKRLFYNKEYLFNLEFRNAPRSRERDKYAQKIAELVEEAINQNKDADIHNQVIFNVKGYDSIKKFSLFKTHKSQKVIFGFSPESNFSKDLFADTFSTLSKIIENADSQLRIPKREGKKTILLITNDWNNFIIVDERNIKEAMDALDEHSHKHINEIFFINKRSLQPGYAISQVK